MAPAQTTAIEEVLETVHRLRAPSGCPWDRAQTHQSLRPYVIEEAFEVLEVLDRVESDQALQDPNLLSDLKEELGDLLMQVLIHSEIAREKGYFDFHEVASFLNKKLIRRHTHVFGDVQVSDADGAFANWERQKALEKSGGKESEGLLSSLPKALPALQRAARIIEKVFQAGFRWQELSGPMAKVEEELLELKTEIAPLLKEKNPIELAPEQKDRIEDELGDLLFTVCNLAYWLKLSPEDALRRQLRKFESRFAYVESRIKESGKALQDCSLEEMDRHWDEAKEKGR